MILIQYFGFTSEPAQKSQWRRQNWTRIQGFLFPRSEAYSYLCFTIYD